MRCYSWSLLVSFLACSNLFMIGCGGVAAKAELQSRQALEQTESLKQRVGNVEGDVTTTQHSVSNMKTEIKNDMATMKDGLGARVEKIEGDMVTKQSWVTNSPWMVVGIVAIILVGMALLVYFILRLFIVAPKERALNTVKSAINRAIRSDKNNLDENQFREFLEQAKLVKDESEV